MKREAICKAGVSSIVDRKYRPLSRRETKHEGNKGLCRDYASKLLSAHLSSLQDVSSRYKPTVAADFVSGGANEEVQEHGGGISNCRNVETQQKEDWCSERRSEWFQGALCRCGRGAGGQNDDGMQADAEERAAGQGDERNLDLMIEVAAWRNPADRRIVRRECLKSSSSVSVGFSGGSCRSHTTHMAHRY